MEINQMLKISVVICTYNREKYLPICLDHLKNQKAPKDSFEIVIINNNSTDSTDIICRDFIAKNPELNVTYDIEYDPGLSHARNKGIALSMMMDLQYQTMFPSLNPLHQIQNMHHLLHLEERLFHVTMKEWNQNGFQNTSKV
jgi:hypothetical protein